MKRLVITRVTETEFETQDGQLIPHSILLSNVLPTVEQFQANYDHWFDLFTKENVITETDPTNE